MTDDDSSNSPRHEADPRLLEAFHYVNSGGGKDVRGKLIDCFQLWLCVESSEVLQSVKEVVADLHNASLLIDDIEDNSVLRRGQPVAHNIFGVPTVINTANYCYFIALEKCQRLNSPEAMKVFVYELLNLHRGQGHDIMWRDNLQCPSEEEYCEMVLDKTGGLFRLTVGLIQAFATKNESTDFRPLVNNLGLYFQIRDDLVNLSDEEYFKSKSFCEDLTEGKFSLPIIHCIKNSKPNDTRLLSILKKRTDDIDVKKYAQTIMIKAGSLKYTRDKCLLLKDEIVQQIHDLGGNEPLLKLIFMLDVQVENLADAVGEKEKGESMTDNGGGSSQQIDST
jgi:geranylgeranyl diphosphate synthase type 3